MKHTIITIGPIHKTILLAKSTKAIWAASYMFSYLIKQLIIKAKLTSSDMILPYFEEKDLKTKYNVGLFPDRLMIKKEITNIGKLIEDVISEFAEKVQHDFSKENLNINEVLPYLKDYIHFHHLIVEPKENNLIFEFTDYLDAIELKNRIVVNANEDVVLNFLENIYYNFLIENEFDDTSKRFPSTIEIATAEFSSKNPGNFHKAVIELFKRSKGEDKADNQQKFIDRIYQNAEFVSFKRNYQKYIAVVQADGDNMGKLITKLYTLKNGEQLVSEFSKNLLEFSKKTVELIKAYNGTPIYAGGDDLLFICPVAHSAKKELNEISDNGKKNILKIKKSVFTLINEIDEVFHQQFTNHPTFNKIIQELDKKPSMSYGFSVSFYKYPLNQALEQGANQLFYKAKQTCRKNAVSFALLKHSGHFIGALFHKEDESYKIYNKMISTPLYSDNYISSIAYKLEPLEGVIYGISLEPNEVKRNKMFDNFFVNNFNESEHIKIVNGKKTLIDILEDTKKLMKAVFSENLVHTEPDYETKKLRNKENLNKIYAGLRFINFLNNEEER